MMGFRLPAGRAVRVAGRVAALPLRELVAGLPVVLAALAWPFPLRWFQVGAEDLAVRDAEEPLAGRDSGLPLPFEPFPLEPLPPAARAADGRDSAPVRRDGRLMEDEAADLRSLECATGRLKWGRDAEDFAPVAGLRTAWSSASAG
jgi:hypothetical protein